MRSLFGLSALRSLRRSSRLMISAATFGTALDNSARACRNSITSARRVRHSLGIILRSGGRLMPRSALLRRSIRSAWPARSRAALQVVSHRCLNALRSAARSSLARVWPACSPHPFLAPPFSGVLALCRLKYWSGSRSMPSRCRSLNMMWAWGCSLPSTAVGQWMANW